MTVIAMTLKSTRTWIANSNSPLFANGRPTGLAKFYQLDGDRLHLKSGEQILSPTMSASGSSCFAMEVSGKGRLNVFVKNGARTLHKKGS